MNVNLQMNYWPTYTTNMAECAEPLIDYVDSLREPGRITAKIYEGVESTEANPENGFMAHTPRMTVMTELKLAKSREGSSSVKIQS